MAVLLPPPHPPILSLFSASTFPHPTWAVHTDPKLPDDSLVLRLPLRAGEVLPAGMVHRTLAGGSSAGGKGGRDIAHPSLHIQSPTPPTTYLRCPPSRSDELGVDLPWLNLHVAPLGAREVAFEFGMRDARGVEGRVRVATFTASAHLTFSPSRPPLLHLPLRFPSPSSTSAPVLTPWSHVVLSLPHLLSAFTHPALQPHPSTTTALRAPPLPDARHARGARWTHVKVHANCRLRRVWLASERGAVGGGEEKGKEELALFAAEAVGEGEEDRCGSAEGD